MRMIRFLLLFVAVLGLPALAQAQVVAARTTLSSAITETATTLVVASATGFTVNNPLIIGNEVMTITAISGTTITVRRSQMGTVEQAQVSGAAVVTGASNHFQTADPDWNAACTRGQGDAAYSPWINVRTGTFWICDNGAVTDWSGTRLPVITNSSRPTSF